MLSFIVLDAFFFNLSIVPIPVSIPYITFIIILDVNKNARVLQLGRLFPQASYELLTEALAKNVDDVNDAAAFLLAKGFGNGDIEGAAAAAGTARTV